MTETLAGIDWEVAERAYSSTSNPAITVNLKTKKVCVTRKAYELAGSPVAVVMLYSRKHKSVGIRPSPYDNKASLCIVDCGAHGCRISAASLANAMIADGYNGSLVVPVRWHQDGLLWGDLTMATKRQRKAAKAKGVAG